MTGWKEWFKEKWYEYKWIVIDAIWLRIKIEMFRPEKRRHKAARIIYDNSPEFARKLYPIFRNLFREFVMMVKPQIKTKRQKFWRKWLRRIVFLTYIFRKTDPNNKHVFERLMLYYDRIDYYIEGGLSKDIDDLSLSLVDFFASLTIVMLDIYAYVEPFVNMFIYFWTTSMICLFAWWPWVSVLSFNTLLGLIIILPLIALHATENAYYMILYTILSVFVIACTLVSLDLDIFAGILLLIESVVILMLFFLVIHLVPNTKLTTKSFYWKLVPAAIILLLSAYKSTYLNLSVDGYQPFSITSFHFEDYYEALSNLVSNDLTGVFITLYITHSILLVIIGLLLLVASIICVALSSYFIKFRMPTMNVFLELFNLAKTCYTFIFLRKQNLNTQGATASSTRTFSKKDVNEKEYKKPAKKGKFKYVDGIIRFYPNEENKNKPNNINMGAPLNNDPIIPSDESDLEEKIDTKKIFEFSLSDKQEIAFLAEFCNRRGSIPEDDDSINSLLSVGLSSAPVLRQPVGINLYTTSDLVDDLCKIADGQSILKQTSEYTTSDVNKFYFKLKIRPYLLEPYVYTNVIEGSTITCAVSYEALFDHFMFGDDMLLARDLFWLNRVLDITDSIQLDKTVLEKTSRGTVNKLDFRAYPGPLFSTFPTTYFTALHQNRKINENIVMFMSGNVQTPSEGSLFGRTYKLNNWWKEAKKIADNMYGTLEREGINKTQEEFITDFVATYKAAAKKKKKLPRIPSNHELNRVARKRDILLLLRKIAPKDTLDEDDLLNYNFMNDYRFFDNLWLLTNGRDYFDELYDGLDRMRGDLFEDTDSHPSSGLSDSDINEETLFDLEKCLKPSTRLDTLRLKIRHDIYEKIKDKTDREKQNLYETVEMLDEAPKVTRTRSREQIIAERLADEEYASHMLNHADIRSSGRSDHRDVCDGYDR